jgi:hypothetical protein
MPELILKERTEQKIKTHCERLYNDLGNPKLPVCLDAIRELLRLDKTFYSLEDPSLLNRVFHKLSIAGKQVISQPTRLLAAWQQWNIKALWLPDVQRILLDDSIVDKKKRWAETHEIGHSILPWHREYLHGDQEASLSVSCMVQIESEANYAAGQILFPTKILRETLPETNTINFSTIKKISKSFGNSITSTLWRIVDTLDVPSFGFICENPCLALPPFITQNELPKEQPRHFFRSRSFAERFSSLSEESVWNFLSKNCRDTKWSMLYDDKVNIANNDGQKLEFYIETVNLTHYVATFAVYRS